MQEHHDQVGTDIPELCRTMGTAFEQVVIFQAFITAFRSCSGVVNRLPFCAITDRSSIKTNIRIKGDGASSAELGGRTGIVTGAGMFGHTWTDVFCVMAL